MFPFPWDGPIVDCQFRSTRYILACDAHEVPVTVFYLFLEYAVGRVAVVGVHAYAHALDILVRIETLDIVSVVERYAQIRILLQIHSGEYPPAGYRGLPHLDAVGESPEFVYRTMLVYVLHERVQVGPELVEAVHYEHEHAVFVVVDMLFLPPCDYAFINGFLPGREDLGVQAVLVREHVDDPPPAFGEFRHHERVGWQVWFLVRFHICTFEFHIEF